MQPLSRCPHGDNVATAAAIVPSVRLQKSREALPPLLLQRVFAHFYWNYCNLRVENLRGGTEHPGRTSRAAVSSFPAETLRIVPPDRLRRRPARGDFPPLHKRAVSPGSSSGFVLGDVTAIFLSLSSSSRSADFRRHVFEGSQLQQHQPRSADGAAAEDRGELREDKGEDESHTHTHPPPIPNVHEPPPFAHITVERWC